MSSKVKRVRMKAIKGVCAAPGFRRISIDGRYCLPDCPPNTLLNKYNRCIKLSKAPRKSKKGKYGVKSGYRVNVKGGPCPQDFPDRSRNPMFCLRACPPGKVRDSKTNRCNRVVGSYEGIKKLYRKSAQRKELSPNTLERRRMEYGMGLYV